MGPPVGSCSCKRSGTITDLQRLTVSLRGGFEPQDHCLLFHFTGQLDAYSERQFRDFIADQSTGQSLPLVLDLSRIDFIDSSGLGAKQKKGVKKRQVTKKK